ncbi:MULTISPECIES: outer membrane protein [unclassified Candidatus Tisiphia]|uniref:outer membrane protein n=1 Tax=unclassified Candidatus Tisiphia TaxID=2996318 RepID=UPI003CCA9607
MKKLLLIAATSTALLTSATSFAATGGFYLKAEGGVVRLNELSFKDDKDDKVKGIGKSKPVISGLVGVGAGYNAMDNVRIELTLDFLTNPEFKCSRTFKNPNDDKDTSVESQAKENVRSLLLSGYVDVYEFAGIGKIFAGAGVGMAQVQQKITSTTTYDGKVVKGEKDTLSYDMANNFAYQLTAGVSFNLADNMNLDLSYSWRDYGETGEIKKDKDDKSKDKDKTPKATIRSHNLMAGIRFDL